MGMTGMNPGAPGFAVPRDEAETVRRLRDIERELEQMFADGTLRGLIDSLPATIAELLAVSVSTGTVVASGAVSAGTTVTAGTTITAGGDIASTGGRGTFASGLSSVGASATDLSALAGLRQNAWQLYTGANIGLYGYAPSTLASKTNLSDSLPFTAADVYAVVPYVYEYIGQVAIRDDPDNPGYDPGYAVPTEIGLIAEHLIERNMSMFVVFNEDGTAKTIDYPLFGAVANLVAVRDLDQRLAAAGL